MIDQASNLYIGVMSGTSADGTDVVVLELTPSSHRLVATHSESFSKELKEKILKLCLPSSNELDLLGELNTELGYFYASTINRCLDNHQINHRDIAAIGLHGQTVRHRPSTALPFTLQAGDPAIVAYKTGITTVADFRRRDMAAGGQGAPLAPAFHQHFFSDLGTSRAVVNVGGIANVTLLIGNTDISGFDCGPGNCLMDGWIERYQGKLFDDQGTWARQHTPDTELLDRLLTHPFFDKNPPKSTGREDFNLAWLDTQLQNHTSVSSGAVQATLLELTAHAISTAADSCEEIYLCGGGSYNLALIDRLSELTKKAVKTTSSLGIEPTWVEAAGFAWLASNLMNNVATDLRSVTGAVESSLLGAIYSA